MKEHVDWVKRVLNWGSVVAFGVVVMLCLRARGVPLELPEVAPPPMYPGGIDFRTLEIVSSSDEGPMDQEAPPSSVGERGKP